MSTLCRRSLRILSVTALLVLASAAYGQSECYQTCDPYNSSCDQYCQVCITFWIEGCLEYGDSTCGQSSAGCIPSTCTPNWQETSRQYRGSYDGRSLNHCNHHVVEWVTVTDQNACNTNSSYRSYSYCDNTIDDYKNACCYPSCCSGYGDLGSPLSCDGVHNC
jgi:hypothetical protein